MNILFLTNNCLYPAARDTNVKSKQNIILTEAHPNQLVGTELEGLTMRPLLRHLSLNSNKSRRRSDGKNEPLSPDEECDREDDPQYAGKAFIQLREIRCWPRHQIRSQHSCICVLHVRTHVCGRLAFSEQPRGRDGSIRYNSKMFCQMQRLPYVRGLISLDEAARP